VFVVRVDAVERVMVRGTDLLGRNQPTCSLLLQ